AMVAYLKRNDAEDGTPEEPAQQTRARPRVLPPRKPHALARDMLHGLTPDEFDVEAKSLARTEALTPAVRERMRTQLVERLKTPIDPPSWGPDWIRRGRNTDP